MPTWCEIGKRKVFTPDLLYSGKNVLDFSNGYQNYDSPFDKAATQKVTQGVSLVPRYQSVGAPGFTAFLSLVASNEMVTWVELEMSTELTPDAYLSGLWRYAVSRGDCVTVEQEVSNAAGCIGVLHPGKNIIRLPKGGRLFIGTRGGVNAVPFTPVAYTVHASNPLFVPDNLKSQPLSNGGDNGYPVRGQKCTPHFPFYQEETYSPKFMGPWKNGDRLGYGVVKVSSVEIVGKELRIGFCRVSTSHAPTHGLKGCLSWFNASDRPVTVDLDCGTSMGFTAFSYRITDDSERIISQGDCRNSISVTVPPKRWLLVGGTDDYGSFALQSYTFRWDEPQSTFEPGVRKLFPSFTGKPDKIGDFVNGRMNDDFKLECKGDYGGGKNLQALVNGVPPWGQNLPFGGHGYDFMYWDNPTGKDIILRLEIGSYNQANNCHAYRVLPTSFRDRETYLVGGVQPFIGTELKRDSVNEIAIPPGYSVVIFRDGWLDLSYKAYTFDYANKAPNVPSNLNPNAPAPSSPVAMPTLTPSLSWSFSDPDGDSQAGYKVQVVNGANGADVKWDSGWVASGNTSVVVPQGRLIPDSFYAWNVQVKDSKGVESSLTPWNYFKTTKAPTVEAKLPLGTQVTPAMVIPKPKLEWTYNDTEGHPQKAYRLKLYNANNTPVIDTGLLYVANSYHDITSDLELGKVYSWEVMVVDSTNMESSYTGRQYFKVNTPPGKPTITTEDNRRMAKTVHEINGNVYFNASPDMDGDAIKFEFEFASDPEFKNILKAAVLTSTQYLEGETWTPIPSGGLTPDLVSKPLRWRNGTFFVANASLFPQGVTRYLRIRGVDMSTMLRGEPSNIISFKVGNRLDYVEAPIETSVKANRVVCIINADIATDGKVPATFKIEVANNAFDVNPTWEDVTPFLKSGDFYTFTNTTKTAEKWGISYRITCEANDSRGKIEINSVCLSFD